MSQDIKGWGDDDEFYFEDIFSLQNNGRFMKDSLKSKPLPPFQLKVKANKDKKIANVLKVALKQSNLPFSKRKKYKTVVRNTYNHTIVDKNKSIESSVTEQVLNKENAMVNNQKCKDQKVGYKRKLSCESKVAVVNIFQKVTEKLIATHSPVISKISFTGNPIRQFRQSSMVSRHYKKPILHMEYYNQINKQNWETKISNFRKIQSQDLKRHLNSFLIRNFQRSQKSLTKDKILPINK